MVVDNLAEIIEKIKEKKNVTDQADNTVLKEIIERIKEASMLEQREDTENLQEAIANIKMSFNNSWVTDRLPAVKNCKRLLSKGIPTPVLSVCGKGTREIRYTQYLAYFLDPKKLHGLESYFLQNVINGFSEKYGINTLDWDEVIVKSEIHIGTITFKHSVVNCICDFEISDSKTSIFIEQKIDSSESNHQQSNMSQLQRYSRVIEQNPLYKNKKVHKFYLTPTGKESKNAPDWNPITHKEIVQFGVKTLRNKSIKPLAKANLARLLMDLVIGPYHKTEESIKLIKDIADVLIEKGYQLNRYITWSNLFEENELLMEVLEGENGYENH